MTASAYDWFLNVEMARAESQARRQRLTQEKDSFKRQAAAALKQTQHQPGNRPRDEVMHWPVATTPPAKPILSPRRVAVPTQPRDPDPGAELAASLASITSLAEGHEPVMVKLVSFGQGKRQALAVALRLLQKGGGLETQDSERLQSRASLEGELQQWSGLFDDRSPSQDVAILRCTLAEGGGGPDGRMVLTAAIEAAFAGHLFAIEEERAGPNIDLILVLAGEEGRLAFENRQGLWQFAAASRKVIAHRLQVAGLPPLAFEAQSPPVHGKLAMRQVLLARLPEGARALARQWAPKLRSHAVRDTLQLLVTATQTAADSQARFHKAVRAFLHEVFADQRFMFVIYIGANGKLQARALVAMRSESGGKLRPDLGMFEYWRAAFAEKAQNEGLKLVATRSYTAQDRPARVAKAASSLNWAVTQRQRARAMAALEAWRLVQAANPERLDAANQITLLEACLTGGAYLEALMTLARQGEPAAGQPIAEHSLAAMQAVIAEARLVLGPKAGAAFAARSRNLLDSKAEGRIPQLFSS